MTCDDCYFSELCHSRIAFGMGLDSLGHEDDQIEKSCKRFKNRNLIVELPCKVGDTVYVLSVFRDRILKLIVSEIHIFDGYIGIMSDYDEDHIYYSTNDIGKTVPARFYRDVYYLSRDDAERALR